MAQHAFIYDWMSIAIQPNGDVIMNCTALYWEENGSAITMSSDPTLFPVVITPSMNAAQITTATMNACKAKGLERFGWNMSTNSVIGPAFTRN